MAALELIIILAESYFFLLTENVIEENSQDSTNMCYFYLGFQAKIILNTRYVPTNDKSNDLINYMLSLLVI